MKDQDARERIRTSLDESLLVEAAAGTGKTFELVERVVHLLAGGADVDNIVCVTFTRKAAGELKLRLREALDDARAAAEDDTVRANLERAVSRLEAARIGTIHSFCAELLRERPVEARVDPAFEEMAEGESKRIFHRAFSGWLEEALESMPPGVSRALAREKRWEDRRTPVEQLEGAAHSLLGWRDFPAPWRREPFDLARNIDTLATRVAELADASEACQDDRDPLRFGLEPARDFARWYDRMELDGPRDDGAVEGQLATLMFALRRPNRKKNGTGSYGEGVSRASLAGMRDGLAKDLDGFMRRANADLAAVLQQELWGVIDRYEAAKARVGKLDFDDLLIKVRDLIRTDQGVRTYLQRRFTHLLVDEFQDTDPLQAEILMLLAADDPAESNWHRVRIVPGKLFLVGDPKQSIYRFRRADTAVYRMVKNQLLAQGVGLVHLFHSFRATAPIQRAINDAFSELMTDDANTGQAGYVPLDGGIDPTAEAASDQPSLIALPIPHIHGRWSHYYEAMNESLPGAIAAYVEWLLEKSGWTVRARGGERVPIEPRHIAILFRRFNSRGKDITAPYTRELEQRTIRHVLVGARSLFEREEVEAMVAAMSAVEWPTDEMAVLATLKGPLFALPDHLLFDYRNRYRTFDPTRLPKDAVQPELGPIVEALQVLAELSASRNDRPFVDTVQALLSATRAHAGLALRPGGNQVLANVQEVCDLARTFELSGGVSFRGFVEHLERAADDARVTDAAAFEEGTEGVRIMKVHGAKGLEFPIVILADPLAPLSFSLPDRHIDPEQRLCAMRLLGCTPWELLDHAEQESRFDESEGVRLAYVAATRARDMLVVPTVGEGSSGLSNRTKAWLSPLDGVVYPPRTEWARPAKAPGCPRVGDRTVLSEPEEARAGQRRHQVVPGLHQGRAGGPGVVWWDPATLDLAPEATYGLRQEQFLAPDKGSGVGRQGIERHAEWRRERRRALESGERASIVTMQATAALLEPPNYDPLLEEIQLDKPADRPAGRRFGTLVHQILRDVAYDATEPQVRALAEMHARILDAEGDEVDAATAAVVQTLAHELLDRARAAQVVHREYPIVFETDQGEVLDGVIDVAFLENDEWVVVDYKTDRDPFERTDAYRRQMAWYLYALEQITHAEVRGVILAI